MKINYFLLQVMIVVTGSTISAQQPKSEFLFPDFKLAKVYFTNGRQSDEKVNYHLLSDKIRFIDKADNQIKEVSDPQIIKSIIIGERVFIPNPDGEGWLEVLSDKPVVEVQYFVKAKPKAKEAGYGGTSELTSTSTYSEYSDGGTMTRLKETEMEVVDYYNYYWIVKDGKRKLFKSLVQFVKLYPKQKEQLNQYIQDNAINFEDVKAIVKLCIYAENLK